MAKKKAKLKEKHFDCPTCSEKTYSQADMICSLRVFSLYNLEVPSSYCLCSEVKSCNFYKKVTKSNIKKEI